MRDNEDWPQIGDSHMNGDRFVGFFDGPVAPLYAQGTPPVNKLFQASVTDAVRNVSIHDSIDVSFDGKHWWASKGGEIVGRLTWTLSSEIQKAWQESPIRYPRRGLLRVRRLLLNGDGLVVNCAGIVYPAESIEA